MGFRKLGEKLIKIYFFSCFFHVGYTSLFYASGITNSVRYTQHTMTSALAVETWVPEGSLGS